LLKEKSQRFWKLNGWSVGHYFLTFSVLRIDFFVDISIFIIGGNDAGCGIIITSSGVVTSDYAQHLTLFALHTLPCQDLKRYADNTIEQHYYLWQKQHSLLHRRFSWQKMVSFYGTVYKSSTYDLIIPFPAYESGVEREK
jgi:hypothetical protein